MSDVPNYRKLLGPPPDNSSFHYEFITNARIAACSITTSTGPLQYTLPPGVPSLRFLVIQLFHKVSDSVSITLSIRNTAGTTFSLAFYSPGRRAATVTKPRNSRIVIDEIPDRWTNICFDLEGLVARYQPGCAYEVLEALEIAPTCFIRWVFLVKAALVPGAKGSDLPNPFKFGGTLESETVVVSEGAKRKSRIPVLGQGARVIHPRVGGSARQEDGVGSKGIVFEDDFLLDDGDEETPAKDHREEEELELVFLEALGCYYCPENQKYYQIDDDKQ
jgi:hypothetical protein